MVSGSVPRTADDDTADDDNGTDHSSRQLGGRDAPDINRLYSYRDNPSIPDWDDSKTLIVFDGVCVLCSGFARFVLKRDGNNQILFAMAQSEFGESLYRHYGLKSEDYETNLIIADGKVFAKSRAFARAMATLGLPWSMLQIIRIVPARVADWLYDRIARNRYRLFGRHDVCQLPSPDMRARLIGDDHAVGLHGSVSKK